MISSVFVFDRPLPIGERARFKRLAHKLRQVDVACLAQCSPTEVSNFERGLRISEFARKRILYVLELEDVGGGDGTE